MNTEEQAEPPLPILILDANALRRDLFFRTNAYRLMVREAHEGRLRLVVPEVVVDEVLNLYREAVATQQTTIRRALRELDSLRASPRLDEQELVVTRAAAEYEGQLRDIFEYAGVEVAPYPTVSHADVVTRALRRAPPFRSDGKDGYRDTLVWETVKELVQAEPTAEIAIVTADWRAFSPHQDSAEILDSLMAEIDDLSDSPSVTRLPNVKVFTDDHVPDVDERLVDVEHQLATEPGFRDDLKEQISLQLLTLSVDQPVPGSMPFEIDVEVDQVSIDGVYDVRDLSVRSAKQWEDSLLLEITGEATVDLDVRVRRIDADSLTSFRFEQLGTDLGNGLVSLPESADIEVIADAIYEGQKIRVESVDSSVLGS